MKHVIRERFSIVFVILNTLFFPVLAQTAYKISGRVTDAGTGEGIPFANIAIKGKTVGTTSDENGKFSLTSTQTGDSLLFSSLGYQNRAYRIIPVATQTIDAVLTSSATKLQEVKIYAKGGDPAYRIIREAIRRRDQFDPDQLTAFQYESYSKVEAYVNNFANERKNGRKGGPVGRLLSKLPAIYDSQGKPAVPVFVSETFSEYYQRANPRKVKERILKSRASGVGISDGGVSAQLTGSSFQQYNFYQNYISLLRKDLPSPLGQAWQTIYKFRLIDTITVGGLVCYQVDFEPKRPTDLAFSGTAWIDTTRMGLTQIDAKIDQRANINFVDEIRIEQEWEDVGDSTQTSMVRLPVLTQLLIDTDEPTPNAPGALVRMYVAARNVKVNVPRESKFYEPPLELAENYSEKSPAFWQTIRPEGLDPNELRAFTIVDSVRNVPFMKFLGEVVNLTAVGYYPLGSLHLDAGPLLNSYAFNNVEGHRLRLGLRTNSGFSRRWILGGYLAYGTRDQQFKYGMNIDYVVSKKPYTIVGIQKSYDIERLGTSSENLGGNTIFAAYTRFGTLRRPYMQEFHNTYLRSELGKGITQTISLRNRSFEPLFPFAYNTNDRETITASQYRTTELLFETRFAPGSLMIQSDNDRFSVEGNNNPVFTFRYQLGMQDVLHGDFSYHRFSLNVRHSFRMGVLGRTRYQVNAGYIPSTIPYPLLYMPLGNETFFRVENSYNLMNFFEFVTDRYVGVMAEHNFEGLFFNRIPAIRRLKWRFLATGNILMGGVSQANTALIPATNQLGEPVLGFQSLSRAPYVEVGYGIDNIFKVFRVDAIHRLTYRNNPNISTFGIKVSAWVNL
ncbi:DUF5686 and carboxypeptidase-like regulatory domain-containing protein [Larkinella punicea]|uniref:Carboxypeptidase-like regulatory domain-containing protein n=1 Tax=Larkinella punicea TaxID=2315727 RepID=A0A368JH39_9BACT|nr:DUF5686 and carboxypeptidase-like regulatory domain-containing protein [Larkinella punicea]RCR66014.1 carboxypeptidase-like regulatory domain-containing protein [Larkinella punicea]